LDESGEMVLGVLGNTDMKRWTLLFTLFVLAPYCHSFAAETDVLVFTGGDPEDGLTWNSTRVVYAVNFGSATDQSIQGLAFDRFNDTDGVSGVTADYDLSLASWQTPGEYGNTANDNSLESICNSMIYRIGNVSANFSVTTGKNYRVHIIYKRFENPANVKFSLFFEGTEEIHNYDPKTLATDNSMGTVVTYTYTANDNTLNILSQAVSGNHNAIPAVVIEEVELPHVTGIEDLFNMASAWLQADCFDTQYCDGVDLNRSGAINLYDFSILSLYWMELLPLQTPFYGSPLVIPGVIQAQEFDLGGHGISYMDTTAGNLGGQFRPAEDVDIQVCTDTGAGYNVSWIANGEWLNYSVNLTPSTYDIHARIASADSNPGDLKLQINAQTLGVYNIESTGGDQNWQTITLNNIPIQDGDNTTLRLEAVNGGNFNINWIEFVDLNPFTPASDIFSLNKVINTSYAINTLNLSMTSFDPNGNWTSSYKYYVGVSPAGWDVGGVTVSRTDLAMEQAQIQTNYYSYGTSSYEHYISGTMTVNEDTVSSPVSWTYTKKMALTQSSPAYLFSGTSGSLHIDDLDHPNGYAYADKWAMIDAVQRLPKENFAAVQINFIKDYDKILGPQYLRFGGKFNTELKGQLLTLYKYERVGQGVVPCVYWVNENDRCILIVSGMEIYCLQ